MMCAAAEYGVYTRYGISPETGISHTLFQRENGPMRQKRCAETALKRRSARKKFKRRKNGRLTAMELTSKKNIKSVDKRKA